MTDAALVPQAWPRPGAPRPIVIVGAGAIVENAHLPAYRRLGLEVVGLHDVDPARAAALAATWPGARAFATLAEAVRWPGAVFDVAVPARAVAGVLAELPERSAVLVQKPLGESLAEARHIHSICAARRLTVALNFQLRFSPNLIALEALLDRGDLGDVVDLEIRVVTHTPWELWPFLRGIPRLEILYHSVHYLDVVRHLLGEPRGVFARATRNPALPEYADVASATILDYGPGCRVTVGAFHAHAPLPTHAMSQLRVEGTRGAAVARLGVNLSYPRGEPDTLEIWTRGAARFESIPLRGSWFTEAFEGPMSNLQRFIAGEDARLVSPVEDAVKTMALVEACYLASAAPAMPIPG
ncbi:MAG TPA: Gfo/Idh/MocA family oxidoreductase [Kofleriaceae bacterium]|nr:Gfo/Idh/MocA family oxidoreductase [Kofleriaceae bacterium]